MERGFLKVTRLIGGTAEVASEEAAVKAQKINKSLHPNEEIVLGGERVKTSAKLNEMHTSHPSPVTDASRIGDPYAGLKQRNILMGSAVAIPAVAGAGTATFLGVQGYFDARQRVDNLASKISHIPEQLLKAVKDLHLPNPSDIEAAMLAATHGAHNIASDIMPGSTALTIGGILIAGVVVYEIYSRF